MNEKISVIVPVYNVQKYIERCVHSIMEQTYDNLEIILIDDGSGDGSGELCDYYGKIDNRIIVIHQENQGLSAARNVGLSIHTGKYVGFVDSDDWIEKDMYSLLYKDLCEYNADISICDVHLINEFGEVVDYKGDVIEKKENMSYDTIVFENFEEAFNEEEFIVKECVWNKLYKSCLWDNICFPIKKVFEDIYTLYHIIERAKIICADSMCGYNYQMRKTSISNTFNLQTFDIIDGLIERYEYLSRKYPGLEMKYRRTIFNGFLYVVRGAYDSGNFDVYEKELRQMTDKIKKYSTKTCNMQENDIKFFDLLLNNYKVYNVISKYKTITNLIYHR